LTVTPSAGTLIVPFWNTPEHDSQVLDEGTDLESNKITGGKQVTPIHGRAHTLGSTDLQRVMSGEDPVGAAVSQLGDMWGRDFDKVAVSTVAGFMATTVSGASMAGNTLDISSASGSSAYFDGDSVIDAAELLGENMDSLAVIAMHPKTYAKAQKDNLIAFDLPSNGGARLPTYQGKAVVVSNRMTVTGSGASAVYDTLLLGPGSIAFAEGAHPVPLETEREAKKGGGRSTIVSRRMFIMHPFGAEWAPGSGVPAKDFPSNAELAAAANWKRVYDGLNVRIVRLKHKLP
jgi:hypothetical protein